MQFEYYVLNWDANKKKVEYFNIFRNCVVQKRAEEEVKKYVRSPKKYQYEPFFALGGEKPIYYGFEALCNRLKQIIMSEEWSRCEYEIAVGNAFTVELRDIIKSVEQGTISKDDLYEQLIKENKRNNKLEKWDCYGQCIANIPMITREVIWQYKQQLKGKKDA